MVITTTIKVMMIIIYNGDNDNNQVNNDHYFAVLMVMTDSKNAIFAVLYTPKASAPNVTQHSCSHENGTIRES